MQRPHPRLQAPSLPSVTMVSQRPSTVHRAAWRP
jgi:hypothetical protein